MIAHGRKASRDYLQKHYVEGNAGPRKMEASLLVKRQRDPSALEKASISDMIGFLKLFGVTFGPQKHDLLLDRAKKVIAIIAELDETRNSSLEQSSHEVLNTARSVPLVQEQVASGDPISVPPSEEDESSLTSRVKCKRCGEPRKDHLCMKAIEMSWSTETQRQLILCEYGRFLRDQQDG